ncbi:MAG TPA: lactate utilization protein B, partial [Polyangiaceae bacterium]|nr:lactate utilization protein B [Polyangiaceae bacterium]
ALPEWEALRSLGAQIKAHTLSQLPEYLVEFEAKAKQHGAVVHFATDAAEHNRIVLDLLQRHGVQRVVKSKSMLTEECGLNPWLERHGIEVTDTDLGELIVQLRAEPPSHIVLPAIHLRTKDVSETFTRHLGAPPLSDPDALTRFARAHLRERFLHAGAGITGVNFAIAETGGLVVCTNEGNADLGTALPPLHIACMGLEKLIPRAADLGVFLRLLARSATGQAVTVYSSHYHGPRPGAELHIVIVDNGRSMIRAEPDHRRALACIRCGACMNTCPVFRRSGGHSYSTHVPGPIGSILAPIRRLDVHGSLPHACSLCGSCTAVCPVGIDLHEQLLLLRRRQVDGAPTVAGGVRHPGSRQKRWLSSLASWVLRSPSRMDRLGALGRWLGRRLPLLSRLGPLSRWSATRELPPLPEQSFQRQYAARRAQQGRGEPS